MAFLTAVVSGLWCSTTTSKGTRLPFMAAPAGLVRLPFIGMLHRSNPYLV